MSWATVFLLFISGIAGGVINAVAGGATLVTFPAMLAAGLPAIAANASNAVAISPGHLVAVFADRSKMPVLSRRFALLCAISFGCGTAGAYAVLVLPEHLFLLPIPGLIAFATVLFAFAPRLQAWAAKHGGPNGMPVGTSASVIGFTSLYGGFFGAGLGVLLTAVLSIVEAGDIRTVKVLKNLLASCVSLAAVVTFIAKGAVMWRPTSFMLGGALIGGYVGGRLIRVLPAAWIRGIVVVAGTLMTVIYAWRYWI